MVEQQMGYEKRSNNLVHWTPSSCLANSGLVSLTDLGRQDGRDVDDLSVVCGNHSVREALVDHRLGLLL